MKTVPLSLAATVLLCAGLTACTGSDDSSDGGSDGGGGDDTVLRVQAAASLTDTVDAIAEEFEARHDGVTVEAVYDSSGTLAEQAADAAPGDVLATADEASMQTAVDAGAVAAGPTPFATNTLVLVVPAGNPAGIGSLADLDDDEVTYVACVDTAPCGSIAADLIADAGLTNEPASLEPDVRATLERVVADEADAGLVYATDALSAGDDVETIEVPEAADLPTTYPIAVLEQAEEPELAQAFVDLVTSQEGQRILSDAGFGSP
ncbi:molybdate ABC transporter substrate-binding protein [Nocardioides lentus]|uniref:Molybdate ABC transporter substrate-binding protein n=1 Tax=Nocardioides lentus TaxID=338077 RepID=A0ABN2PC58_9ACTN